MNARCVALLLIMALPWWASAAPPEPTTTPPVEVGALAPPPVVVLVNCAAGNWPTLQQVARDVGISVFDPPEHVRQRAVIAGLRACRRGATDVNLVFLAPTGKQQRTLVGVAGTP